MARKAAAEQVIIPETDITNSNVRVWVVTTARCVVCRRVRQVSLFFTSMMANLPTAVLLRPAAVLHLRLCCGYFLSTVAVHDVRLPSLKYFRCVNSAQTAGGGQHRVLPTPTHPEAVEYFSLHVDCRKRVPEVAKCSINPEELREVAFDIVASSEQL